MSKLSWPESRDVPEVYAWTAETCCVGCGGRGGADDVRRRRLSSFAGPIVLRVPIRVCDEPTCPRFGARIGAEVEAAFAPPYWSVTWELFVWMGHRRFSRHWSVPHIRDELRDRVKMEVSDDWVEDSLRRYQIMVAAKQSDLATLREEYAEIAEVILTIDGLQPEKGHETLYVVRELVLGRVWFAEPLLSSSTAEVQRLFDRAKGIVEALGKRVHLWMSDKQKAFVTCVAAVFPGVPHRYCNNHFLRDLAKPILEKDSHAKVQMRRKVRGLRQIEKQVLAQSRDADRAASPAASPPAVPAVSGEAPSETAVTDASATLREVVLDYCSVVRGILNDDQGSPLMPPGVRMEAALADVQESLDRLLGPKKGGLATATGPSPSSSISATMPSPSSAAASCAADSTSHKRCATSSPTSTRSMRSGPC